MNISKSEKIEALREEKKKTLAVERKGTSIVVLRGGRPAPPSTDRASRSSTLQSTPLKSGPWKEPQKLKKYLTQNGIHERLQKKSPWYQSIIDPKHHADVKIPDENGCDTGTLQMVLPVTVPVNANGVAGLRVTSPYPNMLGGHGYNYQKTNPLSTGSSIQWGDGATLGNYIGFVDSNDALQAYSQGVRIVSASVTGFTEVTTLSDSGEGTAFVTPFDMLGQRGTTTPSYTVPYADIVKNFGSSTIPNNKHKNIISRWFPTQKVAQNQGDTSTLTVSYKDFCEPNTVDANNYIAWEFGCVFVGLPASSGNAKFEIVINYEYIPVSNAVNIIDAGKSPVDPQEEQLVEAWLPAVPKTGIVSDKAVSSAPSASPIEEPGGGTGFGLFFDVLQELVPLATGALALL